jgi:hypothetical protein
VRSATRQADLSVRGSRQDNAAGGRHRGRIGDLTVHFPDDVVTAVPEMYAALP